jgi:hypothetical protein
MYGWNFVGTGNYFQFVILAKILMKDPFKIVTKLLKKTSFKMRSKSGIPIEVS